MDGNHLTLDLRYQQTFSIAGNSEVVDALELKEKDTRRLVAALIWIAGARRHEEFHHRRRDLTCCTSARRHGCQARIGLDPAHKIGGHRLNLWGPSAVRVIETRER